jgi:GntR family transcriptional repressor for pyruvate dehydrogenase complex
MEQDMDTNKTVTVIPKAAEIIAGRIRRAIADGTLEPGSQLSAQPELAEEQGVSAPTMREALRILETEGLIGVRRGVHGGAYVKAPNLTAVARQLGMFLQIQGATMRDLYEARMVFEPAAVGLLAARWSAEAETDLRACLDEELQALDDPATIVRAGSRFHVRLLQRCGNVSLAALGTIIEGIVQRHLEATVSGDVVRDRFTAVTKEGIRRQEKLVDLMAKGQAAAAERHWRRALEDALVMVEKSGQADTPLDLVE